MRLPKPGMLVVVVVLLVVSACTSLPKTTDNTHSLPVTDHQPDELPKATILALHGMNDYRRAFDELGVFMKQQGVRVLAIDQRGFGDNPDRGRWAGSERMTEDVILKVNELKQEEPNTPVFILGESMGASVAILAADHEIGASIEGVILSAPAVWGGDALNPFYRAVLWTARRVAPGWTLTGRSLKRQASDNIEALRELGRDPKVIKQTTIDAIGGLVELMDDAHASLPSIEGRFLVLRGDLDEIVPKNTQADVAKALATQECLSVLYPKGWHLLLRDHQRQTVFKDILAWVDRSNPPSGLAKKCGKGDEAQAELTPS